MTLARANVLLNVCDVFVAPGDLDDDGGVDSADLGALLGAWGGRDPAADLSGDGVVDGSDLGILLSAWTC